MRFFGLFRAKMNTIGIQNPKLIVTNDYQQFLAHFEWFLALFQISDVKPELSPVELKVCKNGIFWAKNLFQKIFQGYFCPLIKVMWKNRAKRASKCVLITAHGYLCLWKLKNEKFFVRINPTISLNLCIIKG